MADAQGSRAPTPGWVAPRPELEGFARYAETIRQRWWLIALVTVVAAAAALAYTQLAPKTYVSAADILVTPAAQGDSSTSGLGLITDSNDPTQVVTTAATLISIQRVAELTGARLRLARTPEEILDKLTIEPIAQSNLVSVRAEAGSATQAQRLANTYAQAAVDFRTQLLHAELDQIIPRLQRQIAALPPDTQTGAGTLSARLAALQSLRQGDDPTLRVAARATQPTSQASPRTRLSVAAGVVAGLILGLGAAFVLQSLDPRVRRESQLRALFQLPVLARVPDRRSQRQAGPILPSALPPDTLEAYRTLRATLMATMGDGGQSILVTSSAPGEGKTTTAINLAHALAQAGRRVLLVEADLRKPAIARAMGIRTGHGLGSVLLGRVDIADAVSSVASMGEHLGFLLADATSELALDRLSQPLARRVIDDARQIADYVVIDAPPLTDVVDALALAQHADAVVVLARLGTSRTNRLQALGDVLGQGGIIPAGLVVLGSDETVRSIYTPGGGERGIIRKTHA